jgi:hypothetical protein
MNTPAASFGVSLVMPDPGLMPAAGIRFGFAGFRLSPE